MSLPEESKDRSSAPYLRKAIIGVAVITVLSAVVMWTINLQRAPRLHINVSVQAADSLKVEFFQPDPLSIDHCRALANRVAETMLAQCATCRLLVSRCLDKLDARQSSILSGQPVDMPVMRTPTSTVAFISEKPELAVEACRESERQTSGKVPAQCIAAGVASAAVSITQPGKNTDTAGSSMLNETFGLILFAGIMSLVALYLVFRPTRGAQLASGDATHFRITSLESGNDSSAFQKHDVNRISELDYASKRVCDIFFALGGLIIFSPLFLLVPIAIKLVDRRCPVIVRVPLVGRHGKIFRMYKFSTMVSNADQRLADLLAQDDSIRVQWEENYKLANDPRILPVIGKFLRKYSINELPQFLNVLKGEMSMVGPRPISREEESKYEQFGGPGLLRQRHSIRPGISGLWQISGRNNVSYRERVQFDKKYLRNCSLRLDLKILAKTVMVVITGHGAY